MKRRILSVIGVLVFMLCAVVFAENGMGANLALTSASGEEVPFICEFTFDEEETEEEWIANWQRALALEGYLEDGLDLTGIAGESSEMSFADFGWEDGWSDFNEEAEAI